MPFHMDDTAFVGGAEDGVPPAPTGCPWMMAVALAGTVKVAFKPTRTTPYDNYSKMFMES